jgi:hypothetical protein
LKYFMGLLENILRAGQQFLFVIHVSRPVECQLKITNVQGDQSPAERQKMLKKSRTHSRRPSPNSSWARRHRWDQLWSLPGYLKWKFEHAPHCSFIITTRPPTRPRKPQSLWLTITWLSFPILPTRRTWSLVISLCSTNWKWNWRDDVSEQCLTSKGNCKPYSTVLRKMTSTVLLKRWKNYGISVYVHKETILKEMAAKIE